MPGAGVSLMLPPDNLSVYSRVGVAWKKASSEVTVKVVVSLYKRCTQPERVLIGCMNTTAEI
jgi:hypothetical protein